MSKPGTDKQWERLEGGNPQVIYVNSSAAMLTAGNGNTGALAWAFRPAPLTLDKPLVACSFRCWAPPATLLNSLTRISGSWEHFSVFVKHWVTYGTHFPASVSLCMKETISWNKTRTKEQSIAVLPHEIRHFSSITTLDWGSCVFFSLLSLEHYRPLGKSPSQKQRSLATQKGRKGLKTARQPLSWKYKKYLWKHWIEISSVQHVLWD